MLEPFRGERGPTWWRPKLGGGRCADCQGGGCAASGSEVSQAARLRSASAVLTVEGGLNRPPMERTRGTAALFRRAATIAAGDGFWLAGSSDGRRVGREFYLGAGDSDAGWNGSGGRRRACGARIDCARGTGAQNGAAGGDDVEAGRVTDMLRLVEYGLLAVSLLTVVGLITLSPRGLLRSLRRALRRRRGKRQSDSARSTLK